MNKLFNKKPIQKQKIKIKIPNHLNLLVTILKKIPKTTKDIPKYVNTRKKIY